MRNASLALLMIATFAMSGCVAKTVANVVTAPVRVAGTVVETAVDATTTTQEEADRNRGREMRKAEEREKKERKRREKEERAADRDKPQT